MARRGGAKPKAPRLAAIDGQVSDTYKGLSDPAEYFTGTEDNGLTPHVELTSRESELWGEYIKTAMWLTHFDRPKAYIWCSLMARFEEAPAMFNASSLAQLRILGSDLGFDPGSRLRASPGGSYDKGKAPKDRYGL